VHAATAARPAPAATGAATARPGTSAPPQFQPDAQAALLGQAYAAYQREDLAEAQRLYAQAQTRQPGADALLGLATIATLQNREAEAQRLYREVLALDPRNATAQAALLDLLGSADGTAAESRLKTLIDREPTPQLYQTLAGVYAAQGRWREAQAAYFESWRGAPDNADYAYNLAVSLDELREHAAALTYYEKALATAGAHRFDRDQAAARVLQLKRAR
jgi:tetratricopeptide (TPR) repeat protein